MTALASPSKHVDRVLKFDALTEVSHQLVTLVGGMDSIFLQQVASNRPHINHEDMVALIDTLRNNSRYCIVKTVNACLHLRVACLDDLRYKNRSIRACCNNFVEQGTKVIRGTFLQVSYSINMPYLDNLPTSELPGIGGSRSRSFVPSCSSTILGLNRSEGFAVSAIWLFVGSAFDSSFCTMLNT